MVNHKVGTKDQAFLQGRESCKLQMNIGEVIRRGFSCPNTERITDATWLSCCIKTRGILTMDVFPCSAICRGKGGGADKGGVTYKSWNRKEINQSHNWRITTVVSCGPYLTLILNLPVSVKEWQDIIWWERILIRGLTRKVLMLMGASVRLNEAVLFAILI